MEVFNWAYEILKDVGFSHVSAIYGNLLVNLLIIFLIAIILDKVSRKLLILGFSALASKTKTSFKNSSVQKR